MDLFLFMLIATATIMAIDIFWFNRIDGDEFQKFLDDWNGFITGGGCGCCEDFEAMEQGYYGA